MYFVYTSIDVFLMLHHKYCVLDALKGTCLKRPRQWLHDWSMFSLNDRTSYFQKEVFLHQKIVLTTHKFSFEQIKDKLFNPDKQKVLTNNLQQNHVYAILSRLEFCFGRRKKRGPLNISGPKLRVGWVLHTFLGILLWVFWMFYIWRTCKENQLKWHIVSTLHSKR